MEHKNGFNSKWNSYKLSVFGDEDTLTDYGTANGKLEVTRLWIPGTSFIIRRSLFPTFPRSSRISRKHLEVICEDEQNEPSCFIVDLSSNGTLLQLNRMQNKMKTPLNHGDEIGILWKGTDGKYEIEFGLRFTKEFVENINDSYLSEKEEIMDECDDDPLYDAWHGDNNDYNLLDGFVDQLDFPIHQQKKAKHTTSNDVHIKKQSTDNQTFQLHSRDGAQDHLHNQDRSDRGNTKSKEDDRRGKLWTKEEDAKLRELVVEIQPKEPQDWTLLAARLGRTVKSCKHKFNDYNLKELLGQSSH